MNKSGIDTCDYSFSPVKGCNNHGCFLHPVHKGEEPGTGKCWAAAMCKRMALPWSHSEQFYVDKLTNHYAKLQDFEPVWFESIAGKPFPPKPSRIAVLYMTDFAFIPMEWTQRVIDKINKDNQERKAAGLPLHQFQWLTKKPQAYSNFQWPDNCQLGFTATDQAEFDERLNGLLTYRYNFNYRLYIYLEPLRGAIDINRMVSRLDWVIVGGGDMPVNPDGIVKIRDICIENNIAFFFKKWGKGTRFFSMDYLMVDEWDKHNQPDIVDGKRWKQFPEVNNG